MKASQSMFKVFCTLSLLIFGYFTFGQTPKKIEIALKLAPLFDIKICDSYTLSYIINETDKNGAPIYNNGLLTQTVTTDNPLKRKSLYNQKTAPLINVMLKKDSLISETIKTVDSIHIYTKKKHQIEVLSKERTYSNTFISTFNIETTPTFLQDTVTKKLINVVKNKDGNSVMNWIENNQKYHFIDSTKIKKALYAEELIEIYNYNSEDKLITKDNTPIGIYYPINIAREEGKIKIISHISLAFNSGDIKIALLLNQSCYPYRAAHG
ncbi:hypothetical protein [Flavobacterium sp. JP2137]|uniref:hypothetical protein n=1 Tax=Flavobacterium sp. JP2137 TaxID=3414510 RepID=UPI003D2FEFD8